MARNRKGEKIDGWLVMDKPLGLSSAHLVAIVRRMLNPLKIGHGGTLDPLASGVLPLALGEATKTVSYVMDGEKTYHFRIRWGEARTTDDGEGEVCATSDIRPEKSEIEAALLGFVGKIEQVPPIFSAVKVEGKRAYDLARKQIEIELKSRLVRIDHFRLLGIPDSDNADFEVKCGKGTYVRSLARDLALALGSVGHVAKLRRIAVGSFHENEAISLEKLEASGHNAKEFVRPITTVLDDIPALAVTEDEACRLKQGQRLVLARLAGGRGVGTAIFEDSVVKVMEKEKLVALARIEDGLISPLRVLNL